MQKSDIKRSSIFAFFIGVAILADILPWPGLGAGLIQTAAQSIFKTDTSSEIWNSQEPSKGAEISSQNSLLTRPRNDG